MSNFRATFFIKSLTNHAPTTNIHSSGKFLYSPSLWHEFSTKAKCCLVKQQQDISVTSKRVTKNQFTDKANNWKFVKKWDLNMSKEHLKASLSPSVWLPSAGQPLTVAFLFHTWQLLLFSVFCQITVPSAPLWKPPEDLLLEKHCCWLYTHALL